MVKVKAILLLLCVLASTANAAEIPKKVQLNIPFLCQAPHGNWAQPWQDACEEAAVIMAIHYIKDSPLDKEGGNQEILGMVNYQELKYGGHHDLTAQKTAQLMKEYYKFNDYKVIYEFTIEDIKNELAKGNVVIAPMAGRLVGNRYYTAPGPAYHFMLFKGYDDNRGEFITNDPGTKRGKDFRYKYRVAFNAIHDWNGTKENIDQGRKAMIVIELKR